jgi:murein DD-endopeptidase MepM/ murein hydrolase activator NlpD
MSLELDAVARIELAAANDRKTPGRSLEEVAQEFESLFVQQLLTLMRNSLGEDGLFEGNTGQDMYASMMDQALAQALSEDGGIGLAGPILQSLRKMQDQSGEGAAASAQAPLSESADALAKRFSEALSSYRVTSPVGWRRDPLTEEWKFHKGVDLAFAEGSPIRSMTSGTVVFSGKQGGYGNTVVVEGPGGVRVRYAHLEKLEVKSGTDIAKGQEIGLAGSTGRSTGPHLHVEIEKDGKLIEPSV